MRDSKACCCFKPGVAAATPRASSDSGGGQNVGFAFASASTTEETADIAVDPAVRAWAASTRAAIGDLAAAAGTRFAVLTPEARNKFGALGPAEIVALTDAAAPPGTTHHAKPNDFPEHPAEVAHGDVDRVLRKELLVNDTHHHIYAMVALSDATALNRLAKFASSEALLVVRGGDEAAASPQWVRAALLRMGSDPAVAVVGVGGGASAPKCPLHHQLISD
jgi:hypothetical protein